jgi:hypothetical protein
MKRLFLLLIAIWKQQLKIYLTAAMIGASFGVFILAPSYDYINSREQSAAPFSSIEYFLIQIKLLLAGDITQNNVIVFYAEIGAMLGLVSLGFYQLLNRRLVHLASLKSELNRDLPSIIRQGEGPLLEFKSSLRWDIQEERVNRTLESVVVKILAGFFNSHVDGTLLIGVVDNGEVIGLEKDYQTLKKPGQDGFDDSHINAVGHRSLLFCTCAVLRY